MEAALQAQFERVIAGLAAVGPVLEETEILRIRLEQIRARHRGARADLARERVHAAVVEERVGHGHRQLRAVLETQARVHHVQVLRVAVAADEVHQIRDVENRARPQLALDREAQAIADRRPLLILVPAHVVAESGVGPVLLPVGGRQPLREGIGERRLRHTLDRRQNRRHRAERAEIELPHGVVLVDQHLRRVKAAVAGANGRPRIEAPREAGARHELRQRRLGVARVVGIGEVEGAVVGVALLPGRLRHDRAHVGGDERIDRLLQAGNRLRQIHGARQPVLGVEEAALVFPPEAEVQRQLVVNPIVVLHVQRIHLGVRLLHRHIFRVGSVFERADQEARPGMADALQVRRVGGVRRGVRIDEEVVEAEAGGLAAFPAHFAPGLDRVALQVLVEAAVQAVALGDLPPGAVHAVGAVVVVGIAHTQVDRWEVENRPPRHVRLVPLVGPQVAIVVRRQRHVRIIALVLDLVVRAAQIECRGIVQRVHGIGGDVPAVALAALLKPELERVGATGVVRLHLIGLKAAHACEGLPAIADGPVEPRREVQVLEVVLLVVLEIVQPGAIVARPVRLPDASEQARRQRIPALARNAVPRKRIADDRASIGGEA